MTNVELLSAWIDFPVALTETIRATIEARHDRDEETPTEVFRRGVMHAVMADKLAGSTDPEDNARGIMEGFAARAIVLWFKDGIEAAKAIEKLVEVLG